MNEYGQFCFFSRTFLWALEGAQSCHPNAYCELAYSDKSATTNQKRLNDDAPRGEGVALGSGHRSLDQNLPGGLHSRAKRVCILMGPSTAHRASCLYRLGSSVPLRPLFCVRTRLQSLQCCNSGGPKPRPLAPNLALRVVRSGVWTRVKMKRQPCGEWS